MKRPERRYENYKIAGNGVLIPNTRTETSTELKPGVYKVHIHPEFGPIFQPHNVYFDELLDLPDGPGKQVIDEIKHFWSGDTKDTFKRYGLVYKRGVLLYGKPGTGKSCLIAQTIKFVTEQGGVVLFNPDPGVVHSASEVIRDLEPGKRLLVVFEEFDSLVNQPAFLSLLDGEGQIDDVLYLATTNYIDNIPDRIKRRPSRFATVIEMGLPSERTREFYLRKKLGCDEPRLEEWIRHSKGFVIDQLKDLIINVKVFGMSIKEAAERAKIGLIAEKPTRRVGIDMAEVTWPTGASLVFSSCESPVSEAEKLVKEGLGQK